MPVNVARKPGAVTIEAASYHRGIGRKYLVRGFGKRAIKVIVRPFPVCGIYDEMAAWHAALEASKLGWKTVYVIPDYYDGDTAYIVNAHGFSQRDEHQFSRYLMPCDYAGDLAFQQYLEACNATKQ